MRFVGWRLTDTCSAGGPGAWMARGLVARSLSAPLPRQASCVHHKGCCAEPAALLLLYPQALLDPWGAGGSLEELCASLRIGCPAERQRRWLTPGCSFKARASSCVRCLALAGVGRPAEPSCARGCALHVTRTWESQGRERRSCKGRERGAGLLLWLWGGVGDANEPRPLAAVA
jgi:hypothetical protein